MHLQIPPTRWPLGAAVESGEYPSFACTVELPAMRAWARWLAGKEDGRTDLTASSNHREMGQNDHMNRDDDETDDSERCQFCQLRRLAVIEISAGRAARGLRVIPAERAKVHTGVCRCATAHGKSAG